MSLMFADGLELDTEAFELRQFGNRVAVEPQVFDVLTYLITHRKRVIPKEELLDNIWGDRFVSESALTSRLKSARRAVGDDGRSQRIIRTVHGRGYRFVADVTDSVLLANEKPSPDAVELGPSADRPASSGHDQAGQFLTPVIGVDDLPNRSDDEWPLLGRRLELQRLSKAFRDPAQGGVLLSGPAGIGKTRLGTELFELATEAGIPTARARGHAEANGVTLAALAHLVPGDLFSAGGLDGEFSRGVLLQRAMEAFEQRAGDERLLLFVDDVDLLDEFSQAVLSALVLNGRVFAVMTQRIEGQTPPAMGHLIGSGPVEQLTLQPLETETIDVLLYRVLGAPIAAPVLDHLLVTSGGVPGICRQLVESSIETGALTFVDGVWTQTGDLTASPDLAALVERRLGGLDDEHRGAAELLAVAGSLELDVLIELTSEEQLDALDLHGMLELTESGGRTDVTLAHPLFGEVLRSQLPKLRGRRVRQALAEALNSTAMRPHERLKLARWTIDTGGELEPDMMLESARMALVEKDDRSAERFVERLKQHDPTPATVQLEAEIHFRSGRFSEVERLLTNIELERLDHGARAQVIRRLATCIFFGGWEFERAIDKVEELAAFVEGEPRATVDSHLVTLRILAGRIAEAEADGLAQLDDASGAVRLELLRALTFACFLQGRHNQTFERYRQCQELAAQLPRTLARPGLSLAEYAELAAMVEHGDLSVAREIGDRLLPQAVALGWIPVGLARLALREGRPALARDRLMNPLGLADALGFGPMAAWMRAHLAEAAVLEGRFDEVAEQVALVELHSDIVGLAQLDMAISMAVARHALGDGDQARATALQAARNAAGLGAWVITFAALHTAAVLGAAEEAADLMASYELTPEGPAGSARALDIRARAVADPNAIRAAGDALADAGMVILAAKAFDTAADLLETAELSTEAEAARQRAERLATVDGVTLTIRQQT